MLMPLILKSIIFVLATLGNLWLSRSALRNSQQHGFYRCLSWETILILFLINVDVWFVDTFSLRQIISWTLLILSLVLIYQGVVTLHRGGKIDPARQDPALIGIEKTTELVTNGVYHYIRHPFYSSLLFLCWGIFLKNVNWVGIILAVITTVFLVITARKEESENLQYFGEKYQAYMQQTKMFIPYIF
jgi:protein-S-isoprenylcysteine O-methyltransferase Ste14